MGHVEELRENYLIARGLYEEVIGDDSRTPQVESATHATLGWMLFRCQELGEREKRMSQGLKLTYRLRLR